MAVATEMIHKPYLLVLDLGTASLGHVAFALDEAGTKPRGILDLGCGFSLMAARSRPASPWPCSGARLSTIGRDFFGGLACFH